MFCSFGLNLSLYELFAVGWTDGGEWLQFVTAVLFVGGFILFDDGN